MCLYIYICVYIYIYICTHYIHIHMYIYIYIHRHTYMHTHKMPMYIYIYIYTYSEREIFDNYENNDNANPQFLGYCKLARTDLGIHRWNRNPDPSPRQLVNWCVLYSLLNGIFVSKLVIWGSSWGWGFRFHWLGIKLVEKLTADEEVG